MHRFLLAFAIISVAETVASDSAAKPMVTCIKIFENPLWHVIIDQRAGNAESWLKFGSK